MDVPLFPAPPVFEDVTIPLSDVPDVAILPRASAFVVPSVYERYAVFEPVHKRFSCTGKRRRTCRNLIHPQTTFIKEDTHRGITEFRVKMMEHRANNGEKDDDDDVVYSIGRYDLETLESRF